jgi:4-amino-4-deoxy-L-arabinose transferase-like glycosyltransferase
MVLKNLMFRNVLKEAPLRKQVSKSLTMIAGIIAVTFAFFSQARLDPQPEHDGYMLATAIGVSEGQRLYVDIVSWYGPATTWLQSLAINILGAELLSIRYLSSLILTLTALVLFLVTKEISNTAYATLAAAIWVSFNPSWSVLPNDFMPQLPWPSDLFSLAMITALGSYIRFVKTGKNQWLIVVGSAVGLGFFSRPHSGLLLFLTIALLLAFDPVKRDARFRAFLPLSNGIVLASLVPFFIMFQQRSLREFFYQTLVLPSDIFNLPIFFDFFQRVTEYPIMLFGLTTMVLLLIFTLTRSRQSRDITTAAIMSILLLLTITAASRTTWPNIYQVPTFTPLYLMVPIFIIGLTYAIVDFVGAKRLPIAQRSALVIGAVAVPGVYPSADALHYWWVLVALLPGALGVVEHLNIKLINPFPNSSVAIIAVGIVLAGGFLLHSKLVQPRIHLSAPVLNGMMTQVEFSDDFKRVDEILLNKSNYRFAMFCGSPLLGVWNGTYQISGNFVYGIFRQYGLSPDLKKQEYYNEVYVEPNPTALICSATPPDLERDINGLGLTVKAWTAGDMPLVLSGMEKYAYRPSYYLAIAE